MKKIAYIVTKNKINLEVPEIIGVVDDISQADSDYPILIIGLEEGRRLIENFSIIEHKVNDRLYWTFAKNEKRNEYEKDVRDFCKNAVYSLIHSLDYRYIPITDSEGSELYDILEECQGEITVYEERGMVYVCCGRKVYGFSEDMAEYSSFGKDKLVSVLSSDNKRFFDNDDFMSQTMRNALRDKTYVKSYIASISL